MLTDKEIQNAKPRAKLYRLADGDGVYLEVSPAGGKLWRLRYRFGGKEKMLALGKYPECADRMQGSVRAKHGKHCTRVAIHRRRRRRRRNGNASPAIPASRHRASMDGEGGSSRSRRTPERSRRFSLKATCSPGSARDPSRNSPHRTCWRSCVGSRPGAPWISRRRTHNLMGRIFRYAVGHGLCTRDPSRDIELRDVLAPVTRAAPCLASPTRRKSGRCSGRSTAIGASSSCTAPCDSRRWYSFALASCGTPSGRSSISTRPNGASLRAR